MITPRYVAFLVCILGFAVLATAQNACPTSGPFLQPYCFKHEAGISTREQARTACEAVGASLPSVRSTEMLAALSSFARSLSLYSQQTTRDLWLGLIQRAPGNTFYWENGDRFAFFGDIPDLNLQVTVGRCVYLSPTTNRLTTDVCSAQKAHVCVVANPNVLPLIVSISDLTYQTIFGGSYEPVDGFVYNGATVYEYQKASGIYLYKTNVVSGSLQGPGFVIGGNPQLQSNSYWFGVISNAVYPQDISETWVASSQLNQQQQQQNLRITINAVGGGANVGNWGSWSSLGQCSATCGLQASRTHYRSCYIPVGSTTKCVGQPFKTESCNLPACNTVLVTSWSNWYSWGSCSSSCGGSSFRNRVCLAVGGASSCIGPSSESRTCPNNCQNVAQPRGICSAATFLNQYTTFTPNAATFFSGQQIRITCTSNSRIPNGISGVSTCLTDGSWSPPNPCLQLNARDESVQQSPCPRGYKTALGYRRDFCFRAFPCMRTYREASRTCSREGATLPIIGDRTTHNEMSRITGDLPFDRMWLGFRDKEWDNGARWRPYDFSLFPDSGNTTKIDGCFLIEAPGRRDEYGEWEDISCTRPNAFICVRRIGNRRIGNRQGYAYLPTSRDQYWYSDDNRDIYQQPGSVLSAGFAKPCFRPSLPSYLKPSPLKAQYAEGERVLLTCSARGSIVSGKVSIQCQNGVWSSAQATCIPMFSQSTCPVGSKVVGAFCYKAYSACVTTFLEAAQHCADMGMTLPIVDDPNSARSLFRRVRAKSSEASNVDQFWLGLRHEANGLAQFTTGLLYNQTWPSTDAKEDDQECYYVMDGNFGTLRSSHCRNNKGTTCVSWTDQVKGFSLTISDPDPWLSRFAGDYLPMINRVLGSSLVYKKADDQLYFYETTVDLFTRARSRFVRRFVIGTSPFARNRVVWLSVHSVRRFPHLIIEPWTYHIGSFNQRRILVTVQPINGPANQRYYL